MKKALKVTFGTMLAVSMIAPVCAHERDLIDRTAVWVVGNYTKPSNNGLSVGDLTTAAGVAPFDGGRRAVFLDPRYRWDYGLGIRYHFPHTHSHVFMTFDRFRDHKSRTDLGLTNLGIAGAPGTVANASVQERLNEFRLGFAHGLHFGHHFCMDVAAFFEYDRLYRNQFEQNIGAGANNIRTTQNKLRGYGPGVGAMGRAYPFLEARHWSVFAGVMNTLLYGREDYNQTQTVVTGALAYQYNPEQTKSVIAKTDVNFGIEYCQAFSRERSAPLFDIAVGMRFMNMFNAFKNGNTAFNPNVQAGGALGGFAANTGSAQDYGRWGPYIQLSLLGPSA